MQKLRMFVVQEPIVAASCLIGGFGNPSSFSLSLSAFLSFFIIILDRSICFLILGC
ncbi:hypothetical protein HanPI659440_Chr03g0137861 [Helianthus annuus]|nr:hypothetical protein HanPI659440_Chr03g0137861 [Helianthus annuus]